jgi:hypothetical protein
MHTVLHRAMLKEREQQLVHLLRLFLLLPQEQLVTLYTATCTRNFAVVRFTLSVPTPVKQNGPQIRMRNDQGTEQTKTFRSSCVQDTPPDMVSRISESPCTP